MTNQGKKENVSWADRTGPCLRTLSCHSKTWFYIIGNRSHGRFSVVIIVYVSGWHLWQTRPMDWTAKTFEAERGVGPHHLCKREEILSQGLEYWA